MRYSIYTNYTFFLHNAQYAGPMWCPYCALSIHVVHVHTIHISINTVGGAGVPLESLQPFQGYNLPHLPWLKGVKTFSPTTGSHSYLSTGPREAGCLSSGGWAGRLEGTPTNQPLPLPFTLFRITSIIKYYLQFTLLNKCFLFYLA